MKRVRLGRRFIWTGADIRALPEFDNDHGWFYGLVWYRGLHIAEIIPGVGFGSARWGWRLPNPITVVRDVLHHHPPPVRRERSLRASRGSEGRLFP